MARWADYVITGVRFSTIGTHIDQVEVADDGDERIGTKRYETRATVIANLRAKKTYVTAPPSVGKPGVDKGASVNVVVVNGVESVRSDANRAARDNLDNLPTY